MFGASLQAAFANQFASNLRLSRPRLLLPSLSNEASDEDHGKDKSPQGYGVCKDLHVEPGPVVKLRALEWPNDSLGRAIRQPLDNSSAGAC